MDTVKRTAWVAVLSAATAGFLWWWMHGWARYRADEESMRTAMDRREDVGSESWWVGLVV